MAKHLEFPAGGDQRVIVTRVRTIKAQHLNTTIYRTITISIVIEVLGGSVGGFFQFFGTPQRLPLPNQRLNLQVSSLVPCGEVICDVIAIPKLFVYNNVYFYK